MNSQQRTSLRLASNSSRIRCIWWPKQSKKRLEPFSDEGDRAPDREGCQGHIICSFDKIICQGAEVGLAKSEMTHSPLHPAISPLSSTRQQVAASVALASNALSCTLYTVSVDTAHKTPQTASNKQALQPTDRTQNYLGAGHGVHTVCNITCAQCACGEESGGRRCRCSFTQSGFIRSGGWERMIEGWWRMIKGSADAKLQKYQTRLFFSSTRPSWEIDSIHQWIVPLRFHLSTCAQNNRNSI